MKCILLIFFPFLSFSQTEVGKGFNLNPIRFLPPCGCTLDQTIINGNLALHPFVISDGTIQTAYRASEGILALDLSGNIKFSFGLQGGYTPTVTLEDPVSGHFFSLISDNLTSNRLHKAPDNDGTYIAAIHGNGNPNGVVIGNPGTIYINDLGGANLTLWVKESGTGSIGWIAK